ncbi:MAG: ABC transporter permease [Roseivivax sp.]|nr:ABC transporter permease [Roseivivax sp.]
MKSLLRSFGPGLTALFSLSVLGWALMLILLPQLTIFERAATVPARSLDSSVAAALARDAATCGSVLKLHRPTETEPEPSSGGGLAIPSIGGGMAVPSPSGGGGLAIPSMTGGSTAAADQTRPYILQCDRTATHLRLADNGSAEPRYLDTEFGIADLSIDAALPVDDQIAQAEEIRDLARGLEARLKQEEANAPAFSLQNFERLIEAARLPLPESMRAAEDAKLSNKVFALIGLRFEKDGQIYERLGLTNLARTLFFAVLATVLALTICYPIAYKAALATPPQRQMWLLLGLVIPYAIVELMRIYAWTAIIDNRGLINSALMGLGWIDAPLALTRSPVTVFLVIAYVYVLFMVFPMLNVMSTLDRNQIEAARDLGASPWRIHTRVIIPHAKPGIAVGCISTFMLAAGAFSVPRIISRGLQAEWFAQTIYNKFFESENSNIGAAYSLAYTVLCFALVALFMWVMRTRLKDFARVR